VTPGGWHIASAVFLRRKQGWVVSVSLRVSAAQLALVAVGVPVLFVGRKGDLWTIFAPAGIAIFFIPALIALLARLFQARRAINLLGTPGPAFEPVALRRLQPPQSKIPGNESRVAE